MSGARGNQLAVASVEDDADGARLDRDGWANCTEGGREPIVVTPQQMRALEDGLIPCPVCGEACGVTLEPTADVETSAVAWNGARWHGAIERRQ